MKRTNFLNASLKCLALLMLIAAPFTAQSKKEREQAKKLQETANKAYKQENYRVAADIYGQAVALVPNNPNANYHKGFSHFKLKEYDAALSAFALALSQGFTPLEIYRIRSYVFYEQKNYDAAAADVQRGLTIVPRDLPFLKYLGEINLAKNSIPAALDAFKKAAAIAPNDADIHYHMARIYSATGDTKAQEKAADTALAKGTRNPGEAFNLLGEARQKLRNPDGAIDAYQKAINSKPDILSAYLNLAEVFKTENRLDDAVRIANKGLLTVPAGSKAFPNAGNFYTNLSWYHSLSDRHDRAVEAAKAAVDNLPNQHRGHSILCRAYNDKEAYDLAVEACNRALKLKPADGESFYYLGNAYVRKGRSVEATRMYSNAVRGLADYTLKNPNDSDGWYLFGNALFADNKYDESIAAHLKCLQLSPRFRKVRFNLGYTYHKNKNRAAALEQYNLLLPVDPALAAKLKAAIG